MEKIKFIFEPWCGSITNGDVVVMRSNKNEYKEFFLLIWWRLQFVFMHDDLKTNIA